MSTDPKPARGYLAAQLGDALVKARGETSQRAQARELGIAGTTLRELELGLANPTLARVEDLAEALDLDVALIVRPTRKARR